MNQLVLVFSQTAVSFSKDSFVVNQTLVFQKYKE